MLLLLFVGCDNEFSVQLKQKWAEMTGSDKDSEDNDTIESEASLQEESQAGEMTETKEVRHRSSKKGKKKRKKASTAPKKNVVVKPVDPLEGKTVFEICQSQGLSLIQWSYDERKSQKECCSSKMTKEQKDELFCDMDWPFGDVPRCSIYDKMQQEIWARYGKIFSSDNLQKYFEHQKWYSPNEHFQENWLSTTARNNIKQLKNLRQNKVNCLSE